MEEYNHGCDSFKLFKYMSALNTIINIKQQFLLSF